MIGTFYRAPSPEAAPYVEVGAEVNPDTVVCIIEAMKVMNEIKAEAKGVITQVMVENAKPVEFGQPLSRSARLELAWEHNCRLPGFGARRLTLQRIDITP